MEDPSNLDELAPIVPSEIARQDIEAIQAGIRDMEAGRTRPLSVVDAELRRRLNIPREV